MLSPDALELAARRLCKLRGLDPDEAVGHGPHYEGIGQPVFPRWQISYGEIKTRIAELEVDEVIASVRAEPVIK